MSAEYEGATADRSCRAMRSDASAIVPAMLETPTMSFAEGGWRAGGRTHIACDHDASATGAPDLRPPNFVKSCIG
jgi:hypothetical protein